MLATGWYACMVALKVYKEVGVMGLWLNTGGVVEQELQKPQAISNPIR